MRNKTTEYPHPVLNEYLKDFVGGKFELNDPTFEETADDILLRLSYTLECPGLEKFISDGFAKVVIRVTCFRTSYREVFTLMPNTVTEVPISKKLVAESLDVQGMIISNQALDDYRIDEFNKNYFGGLSFVIRKGDVLADESGMRIKLNTILEKTAAGVVQFSSDPNIDMMKVRFATQEESDPVFTNYIVILLPEKEYVTYGNLTKKKHLKYGIERFLQSALILPVIVEALALIKEQESLEESEVEDHYIGTIWADSLIAVLKKHGIDELATCNRNLTDLANMILNDVAADAINDLMQKMKDWSTIRQEEDIL